MTVLFGHRANLIGRGLKVYKKSDSFMKFVSKDAGIMNNAYFRNQKQMKKLELAYNHHLIFPLLQATVKSAPSVDFEVGETKLRAMTRELKFYKEDTSNFYNADGLYSSVVSNFTYELALLETTGPFEKYNWHKETQDFVKAGYGLVAMLHSLGRKFFYGDIEIFKKINVFFLQATPTKFRVWKMALVDKEVYLLEKCSGVDLQHYESREILLRNLMTMFWKLKLKKNVGRVEELARSHQENVKKAERGKVAMEELPALFK